MSRCQKLVDHRARLAGTSRPRIQDLQLTRLHCHVRALFPPKQPNFTHSLFAQITHLELFDYQPVVDQEAWLAMAKIPHLTHLAFSHINFRSLLLHLLQRYHSLRVLVVLLLREILENHGDFPELIKDPPFVMKRCNQAQDWQTGAHTVTTIGGELRNWLRSVNLVK